MANLLENHLPVVQSDGLNSAKAVAFTGAVSSTGAVTASGGFIASGGGIQLTPQASTVVIVGDYGSGTVDGNLAGKGSITINAQRGQVTTATLAMSSGSTYVFDLVNNKITAGGMILTSLSSFGNTGGAPVITSVTPNIAGSASIRIGNASTISLLNGTVVVNFIVLQ